MTQGLGILCIVVNPGMSSQVAVDGTTTRKSPLNLLNRETNAVDLEDERRPGSFANRSEMARMCKVGMPRSILRKRSV
jgi:hypothetical protein